MRKITDFWFDKYLEDLDNTFNKITFMRNLTERQKDKLKKKLHSYKERFQRQHINEYPTR